MIGTLLVVEDEESIRLFYERFFTSHGYQVRAVARAEDARPLILSDTEFDALLLDVRMPGIGARGLWKFIVRYRPEYRTRTVFVTGDILGETTWDLLEESGQPYILKPFENEALLRQVGEVVERVRQEREAKEKGLGGASA